MKKLFTVLIWSAAGAAFMAGAVLLIDGIGNLLVFLAGRFGAFGTTVIIAGVVGGVMGANAGMTYYNKAKEQAQ